MNSRHAATLALLGWYLMIGPPTDKAGVRNTSAPLSQWELFEGYDTAEECRNNKVAMFTKAREKGDKANERLMLDAKCVASDDPRLKPK